ncbi:MAG: hypothetical protein R8K22_07290 [Mariprofundaceae bacterium]
MTNNHTWVSHMNASYKEKTLRKLSDVLPAISMLSTVEELMPYEGNELSVYQQIPAVVVLPNTIEQATAILKLCHDM